MRVSAIEHNMVNNRQLKTSKNISASPSFNGKVDYQELIISLRQTGENEELCQKVRGLLKGKYKALADKLDIDIHLNSSVIGNKADVMIQAIRSFSPSTMREKWKQIDYAVILKPSVKRYLSNLLGLDNKVVKSENLYDFLEAQLPKIEEAYSKPEEVK